MLTFTTLGRCKMGDVFFSRNRIWHFMQIVSTGDNLHEMSNSVFWENLEKKNQYVVCCKFYPSFKFLNIQIINNHTCDAILYISRDSAISCLKLVN